MCVLVLLLNSMLQHFGIEHIHTCLYFQYKLMRCQMKDFTRAQHMNIGTRAPGEGVFCRPWL